MLPLPRKQHHRTTSNVSSRTTAMQRRLKLSKAQADLSRQLFKRLALDRHGDDWGNTLTQSEHDALCRMTATMMRKDSGKSVSTDQVRKAIPLARNTPEVRTGYPVDLDPDLYAFIAREHAINGGTMKAIASAIIRAHVDRQEA